MVRRGEVWWVNVGDPVGSAPGYRRPAVVVSSDRFNRSRIATVVVAAVTSNTRLADAPGNVALAVGSAGLPKASVVNVSQILAIDRTLLEQRLGSLDPPQLRAVGQGLRLALDL